MYSHNQLKTNICPVAASTSGQDGVTGTRDTLSLSQGEGPPVMGEGLFGKKRFAFVHL